MTKYRLTDDIDLTRHVRTPAGVAYFHKPIGSPIGGSGRGTVKVAEKAAYVVNGRSFDAQGVPVAARRGGGPVAFMSQSKVEDSRPPVPEFEKPTTVHLKPRAKSSATPGLGQGRDIEADIKEASTLSDADISGAIAFWNKHKPNPDDADADNLSTDLGVNPKYKERSLRELRKAIKSRATDPAERADLKTELVKRVALQKAVNDEKSKFTNRLTKRLEDAPDGSDIAPIIGETLAAHPKLGPLAHIWDRLRLTGYNFKKSVTSKEAGDELPRIIARNVASVLIALLAIHLGLGIPGLGGGG